MEGVFMSKYIPGNQKHLSLQDRIYIQNELSKGSSFKDIARFLYKDTTTISKEVKSRRLSDWWHKGTFYNAHNFCIHRYHCIFSLLCVVPVACRFVYHSQNKFLSVCLSTYGNYNLQAIFLQEKILWY